jgi:hypothetical protein
MSAQLFDNPWAFGPYCWMIDRVIALPEPVHVSGLQGLWPVKPPLLEQLRNLCPEASGLSTALTIKQPYASAILLGKKRVENRVWRRTLPAGGLWLGLHAASTLYPYTHDLIREFRTKGPHGALWPDVPSIDRLPLGKMLGIFHVSEILPFKREDYR